MLKFSSHWGYFTIIIPPTPLQMVEIIEIKFCYGLLFRKYIFLYSSQAYEVG